MSLNDLANKHGTDKGDGNYDKHDYAHVYEDLLGMVPKKDRPLILLEIGVWDPRNPGASIRMWREFLPEAEIHGADINEGCLVLKDECNVNIHIIDQGKPEDLKRMMESIKQVDFVVDDGSHILDHTANCFDVIWPYVTPGGFYCIEDLQAPQAQPKEALIPFVQERGASNFMWPSYKLFVVKKD